MPDCTTDYFDAVICGCGPVGAALACLLAREGLSVCIIERRPDVFPQPRAMVLDWEIMRALQFCGIAADRIFEEWVESRNVDAVLVRPDRYIHAAVADEADLFDCLTKLAGWITCSGECRLAGVHSMNVAITAQGRR